MKAMTVSNLDEFWKKKELEKGEIISVHEVARATGLNWETIKKLRDNKTRRFDSHVIGRLCKYFGVPNGAAIPFLQVQYEEVAEEKAAS